MTYWKMTETIKVKIVSDYFSFDQTIDDKWLSNHCSFNSEDILFCGATLYPICWERNALLTSLCFFVLYAVLHRCHSVGHGARASWDCQWDPVCSAEQHQLEVHCVLCAVVGTCLATTWIVPLCKALILVLRNGRSSKQIQYLMH